MIKSHMTCPTKNQWEGFLNGDLIDAESHSFEQHLDQCPACAAYLKAQHAPNTDSLDLALATAIHSGEIARQAVDGCNPNEVDVTEEAIQVQGLIKRIRGLAHRHEPVDLQMTQERAAEVLWLLEPGNLPNSLGGLAHYDLLEFLGAGSSGVVFAARDQLLHRDVAIKILRPSLGAAAQDRFLSEARAIASLAHENIVTIYEVGQDHGLAYFTMPWLPGESLEKRLQNVTFLPEQETRELAKQVCAALDAAHQRQLVHRDVKPANIWVDTRSRQCKLLDFGLARAAELDATVTATGMLAGTPSYMSPEQTRGEELDHRSDLFSLGCLLYRCMTGRLPFAGSGVLAILQAIQHHTPVAPDKVNSACSQDLSRLIMALLEKEPARRPKSANEVRQALDSPVESWPWLTQDELTKPILSESSSGSNSGTTKTSPQSTPKIRSKIGPPIRGVVLALTLGLFGYGLWLMVSDVIRIQTADGEIVIETDDPNVQIEVLQDGRLIHILDAQSQRSLKIAAGTYSIQPSRSATDAATFQISPGVVELTRGEKRIVKVTKVPAVAEHVVDKSATGSPTSELPQPTYQGRTIEQWVQILAVEHDRKTLADGIKAMSQLMGDDPIQQDIGIELVRKVLRERGLDEDIFTNDDTVSLRPAVTAFFESLPSNIKIEFLKAEMAHGNHKSIDGINQIYLQDFEMHRTANNYSYVPTGLPKASELRDAYINSIELQSKRGNIPEITLLNDLAQDWYCYWHYGISWEFGTPVHSQVPPIKQPDWEYVVDKYGPDLALGAEQFLHALKKSESPVAQVVFAQYFVFFRIANQDVISRLSEILVDKDVPIDTRLLAFRGLCTFKNPGLESTIPAMLTFNRDFKSGYYPSSFMHVHPDRDIESFYENLDAIPDWNPSIGFSASSINGRDESGINRSISVIDDHLVKISIVYFLFRVEAPPDDTKALATEFLRGQIRTLTAEESELAREGMKPNMSNEQRHRLSGIYVQAIINYLANATLQKWNIDQTSPVD